MALPARVKAIPEQAGAFGPASTMGLGLISMTMLSVALGEHGA